jgi:hypothetical protein
MNSTQVVQISLYGLVLTFLAGSIFQAVTKLSNGSIGGSVWEATGMVVSLVLAIILHETIHGVFFKIFGGEPRFGAGITSFFPYFYATSPDTHFSVRQMYVIGLAPFILLSLALLAGGAMFPMIGSYFAVAFVINFSGAIGDLWLCSQLIRFQRLTGVTIVDHKSGLAVYSSDPRATRLTEKLANKASDRTRFGYFWGIGTIAIFAFTALLVLVGPLLVKTLTIGPSWLPLVSYQATNHSTQWNINFATPIIGGLIFAIFAKIVSRNKDS